MSDDIGEVVFNLIDGELLSKTEGDRREDFHGLSDFDQVLVNSYEIVWER